MAKDRTTSILESARKAAEREKAYKIFEEKNNSEKSSNQEEKTVSTGRTSSILESARKAAGREKTSRTNFSSAPTSSKPRETTRRYTDFNTESNNAYTSAKDKVNSKTTITSAMSEDDRQARIKEIKSELNELSKARSGLSRAKLYGNVDDMIASNNARTYELTKELKELESYVTLPASETANGWEIAGNSAMSGLGTFNKGLFSTLDFILPTEFLGEYDFVSNLNEYYSNQDAYWKQQKEESVKDKSTATKILADIGEGTVAALPNAILAVMSGGSSAAGTALGTAPASTGFFSTFGNTASTMAKNPMYWTSFAQTVGTDYEEAKANGANEFVATATAIIKSGINAGIEIGGGIETLPDNLKSGDTKLITQWVKSMVEEGNEEVVQGIVSGVVDKAMYDRNKEIVSFSDENAIVNPQRMAKEFGMGAAVGGVLGGGQIGSLSVANNIISRYAKTAKTVEAQNAYADSIIKDENALKALIEEGKTSGEGTVSAEVANEIETAIANGEEVTREQVKRLIQSTEVYIKEEETTEADTLEKAAQDVVASRNKISSTPILARVEAMSLNHEPISIEEAKQASGYGENGSKILSEAVNNATDKSFSEIKSEMHIPYLKGMSNQDIDIKTDLEREAYYAGKMDRTMQDIAYKENTKNASIYKGSFTENEYTKNFTDEERTMISTVAKSFGMDVSVVDKIIANVINGVEYEANAEHQDGKMRISSTTEKVISELVLHEGGHRMRQLAPTEFGVLMDALYARADGRSMNLGVKQGLLFDEVKAEHDRVGISLNTSGYIEEFAVRELETIFSSAEEFNKWYAEISQNHQVKTAWEKFVAWISEVIEDIKRAWSQRNMTAEEKAEARKTIKELERIKELYTNAYKAAEKAVAERGNSVQNENSDTNSDKNLEIKTKKGYNGNTMHSLKWHTDLTRTQLAEVEKRLRQVENHDEKRITDTASWYKGRIGGDDLFVIYSTEYANNPTILYEVKGAKAKLEQNILLDLLEEEENGKGINGKSSFTQRVSQGSWMQNVNGSQHNFQHLGSGQNNRNAGVLQRQPQSNGSRAFRNVIENLFKQQEINGSKLYSLKDDANRSNKERNREKNGVAYSLKDSDGNTLTEAQAEFFKDSKVRDENGNLLVVYHGSPAKFTVFDHKYLNSHGNAHGRGFYFTEKKSLAEGFEKDGGQLLEGYLNITNPMSEDKATMKKADLLKLIKATVKENAQELVYDGGYDNIQEAMRDTWISNYVDTYNTNMNDAYREVLDIIWSGNTNDVEIIAELTNAGAGSANTLKLTHDILGYDGVIYTASDGTHEFVSLISNQFKDADNTNPTSDPDIRYSLKEDTSKLSAEEQKSVNALGEGAKVATNKNGDMLIATNKNRSTVMYSLKTYQDGGKEALKKALIANGHTEAEINETLALVDDAANYLTILAAGYAKSHNYTALSNHLIADVITNVKTGKQVISSIVNNGEYPVNIDLALICKKRVAYMNLMNRLIDDGIFDKVNYGGEAIAKVNDLLRMDGFETACLGCFVESRRLQFQTWAETIVSEWNAEVDKRKNNADNFNFADGKAKLTDAEMDALAEELKNAGNKNAQGNLNLGQGSVQTRMGRLLDKVPSLQKHLTVADLLKPSGLTALRAYDSNLFSIVKSRYGAASPKIVQDYNPYASEIAMMTFSSVKNITSNAVKGAGAYRTRVTNEMGGKPVKQKGETEKALKERKAEFNAKVEDEAIRRYLYDIGGARIQSFSDFMIENVFDYIQIFADLSAKRLPLHGYTKEIVALRLFGMTGAKWNGSWIAHVDRNMGKEYAGLLPVSEAKDGSAILVHTNEGDYAIGFDDYARYKATNKKTFIQSIGMKDMIALQLDPRYSPYVGSITIGVSDKQILAMLDSPLFRFVIPYHSSGMLPQFAKLVGVDLYNDYTDYQNTTVKQWYDAYGIPCEPISGVEVDTSYNFNAEVQKVGDAKKAANNYLKWCGEKHPVYDKKKKRVGYVTFNPKFSDSPYGTDFSKHENYYKMLEDFNSYDNITEKPAVQGAVTMNFPSEQNRLTASEMEVYQERLRETGVFSEKEIEKYSEIANKTFKELIADEVKGRAEYQKAQSPKWENTVKNVEQMLLSDHKRESHSLKGSISATKLFDTIDGARKGEKEAINKLSQYAEKGTISTELYNELIEKYGAIPAGENPHREIQVPQKTSEDKKVSQTVRTILEAKVTPDMAVPTIEKMVEDGVFSYEVYTDKQAIKDQEDYLREYGWTESLNDWFEDVDKGIVSKQHTVMGWALYNNAVNRATETTDESIRNDAMKTALNVLDAMVRHQRSAAQALQATRVLKKMSPEAQLYGIQKSVSAFQNELKTKYGKKAPDLKIDEELAEQFLNAETQEEREAAMENIYKDIGRQMPSDWLDRWNAWRYLAMLGNPRTHIRNIAGNAFFAPVVATKNLTATAIESVVYRVSGKKMLRGKALVSGSKADRKLLKAAWNDYANVADIVSNGGKYNDSAVASQSVEDGRKILNNWQPKKKFLKPIATVSNAVATPLEVARKANSKALEKEDVWFSKPHYAYALAQYCKANNITAEQIERGMAIAPARDYAIKEAQKATYKDTNGFSQLVSSIGRNNSVTNHWTERLFRTVVEGVLPFRKTPANILVRGVEYSPLGLLKSLTVDLVKVGKGDMKAHEAIDNISAGLTGTGLVALGVFLAAQGLIRGHGEEEEEERKFKEMMGHQAYSLELPNGTSITLDWLAPEALPFFVGVNIWESTEGQNEGVNLARIISSVTSISDPMLNMSFLQGINDLFESVGYASSNDTSALVAVLASAVTSYLTQGIPTLFGQIERTGEENRMTTYTEKNNFLTGDVQYTLGKASAKIPFWDYNQIPYIDAWGRKEASEVALTRGLNNFLNPAYTSNIETSKMEKELLRLYEKTGEGGVFPSRADKHFNVGGKRIDLTATNYVKYATLKGQKSYKLVSDLVKSKSYKQLDDAEKVKAIKEAYDYANQKAKQAVNSKYEPDNWVTKADEFGSGVGNYFSFRSEVSNTRNENGGKISKQEVVDIVLDMAQNDSEIWNMYLSEYDSSSASYVHDKGVSGEDYMNFLDALDKYDKPNKNGKYGTYTNEEYETAIRSIKGLSRQEKAILWQSKNPDGSTKNNPWR